MKPILRGAGRAVLLACCLFGLVSGQHPTPAAAVVPPIEIPTLVQPELFPGFEPIAPDRFGFSPDGRYLVVQDDEGLRVIDAGSGEVYFSERVLDDVRVGFDPSDERLFLLETLRGNTYRFRFIELKTGIVLLDERLLDLPEIRTNLDASANLLVVRGRGKANVLVFDCDGFVSRRRAHNRLFRWGFAPVHPAIAFLEPVSSSVTRLEVVNVKNGRITLRDTLSGRFEAGFEPDGPRFLVARPTSPRTFRVLLADSLSGVVLVNRTFNGPVDAGFTADSQFLGVVGLGGIGPRLSLFRTKDGRLVRRL